jgi:hypothetical protein
MLARSALAEAPDELQLLVVGASDHLLPHRGNKKGGIGAAREAFGVAPPL